MMKMLLMQDAMWSNLKSINLLISSKKGQRKRNSHGIKRLILCKLDQQFHGIKNIAMLDIKSLGAIQQFMVNNIIMLKLWDDGNACKVSNFIYLEICCVHIHINMWSLFQRQHEIDCPLSMSYKIQSWINRVIKLMHLCIAHWQSRLWHPTWIDDYQTL